MAFDEKMFREKAKEANFDEATIQQTIDEHYANNKAPSSPAVETAKSMVDLFTTKHPTLGISPADVALYAGGAGAAFAAGKKAIDLAGQGLSAAGTAVKNKIFGQAGSSVPPTNPTASTQALMTVPDIEKPILQTNLSIQEAADRMASLQPKTPVEKAEMLLGQDSPSAINRSVPPAMGPNQFTGSTPPGTFGSPAAPIGGMTSPAPTPPITPEITGQTGAAVKPSVTEKVAELNQRIQPLPAPTEKELAFAEKQLKAGKELPLVESRRSPVEKAIFDEEKKLNAAQRQLATQLGGDKVPETEWRSFQDEVYGKNPPKSGAKGGGVPEWDSVVKTAKENPKKYPAIVSAIENIEKKYPKQSGKANIGMLMSLAGNLLGGIGIAKALKEGDTATAGLGAIDQLLANTAMLAGKKGALGAIGSAAGRLSPFMLGMTPTAVSSGTLNSPEAQALFRNARPTGAVPPP